MPLELSWGWEIKIWMHHIMICFTYFAACGNNCSIYFVRIISTVLTFMVSASVKIRMIAKVDSWPTLAIRKSTGFIQCSSFIRPNTFKLRQCLRRKWSNRHFPIWEATKLFFLPLPVKISSQNQSAEMRWGAKLRAEMHLLYLVQKWLCGIECWVWN